MMVVTTPSERERDSPRVSCGSQTPVHAGPPRVEDVGACLWAIRATHKAKVARRVPPGTEGHFWRGGAGLPAE